MKFIPYSFIRVPTHHSRLCERTGGGSSEGINLSKSTGVFVPLNEVLALPREKGPFCDGGSPTGESGLFSDGGEGLAHGLICKGGGLPRGVNGLVCDGGGLAAGVNGLLASCNGEGRSPVASGLTSGFNGGGRFVARD